MFRSDLNIHFNISIKFLDIITFIYKGKHQQTAMVTKNQNNIRGSTDNMRRKKCNARYILSIFLLGYQLFF